MPSPRVFYYDGAPIACPQLDQEVHVIAAPHVHALVVPTELPKPVPAHGEQRVRQKRSLVRQQPPRRLTVAPFVVRAAKTRPLVREAQVVVDDTLKRITAAGAVSPVQVANDVERLGDKHAAVLHDRFGTSKRYSHVALNISARLSLKTTTSPCTACALTFRECAHHPRATHALP